MARRYLMGKLTIKPKVGDFIVYIFIIVLIGMSFIRLGYMGRALKSRLVIVELNGEKILSMKLQDDTPSREIPIDIGKGGYNILKISSDGVHMLDANCPDRLCVYSGKINGPGQSIICIPHKLIVRILGSDQQENAVDDTAS